MKKIFVSLAILLTPFYALAQTEQYFIYNIVTFEGDFNKEGIKVKVDNGKSVEKLKDEKGNRIKFCTPAAALMYFFSKGWSMYLTGNTTSGATFRGIGEMDTTSYWIFRKPCTKEEFEKAVEEGIR